MLNELAKAGVMVAALTGAAYAPWWVPPVKAMVNNSMVNNTGVNNANIELFYYGDVIDTFATWGECVEVLPAGVQWSCRQG